jgi:hypothetical protein
MTGLSNTASKFGATLLKLLHILTLREGELDSRLRDRDRTIENLNLRLRELNGLLRKEQATRELPAVRSPTGNPPAGRLASLLRQRSPSPKRES